MYFFHELSKSSTVTLQVLRANKTLSFSCTLSPALVFCGFCQIFLFLSSLQSATVFIIMLLFLVDVQRLLHFTPLLLSYLSKTMCA